eukprot:TRINITY_DN24538_c0_g1_i1.p1 TRINITY_DN24538_c0_g1~~TRINITY_DN24538_c0_g1_i1.p1  ORF type:complete len:359 (+),score=71.08 TRINITY_DN24538_c0_g1_i1:46-1122(+)
MTDLKEKLIADEETYINDMQQYFAMEQSLISQGVLVEEEASRIFQALTSVVRVSTDFVNELKLDSDVGKPLLWLTKQMSIFSNYTNLFQNFIQPLFVRREELKPWLTSRDLTLIKLLKGMGAPISRLAKIRVSITNKTFTGIASEVECINRRKFLAASDRHIRTLFDNNIVHASYDEVSRIPKSSRPKSNLLQSGELLKEYARGKHPRYFFLFSDKLMHFKSTEKGLIPKGQDKNILNLRDVISVDKSPDTAHRKNVIRIKSKKRSDMLLMADTPEEQEHWVMTMQAAATRCASENQFYSAANQVFEAPFLDLDATSTRTETVTTHTHQLSMDLPDLGDMYSDPYPDPDEELRPASPP